MAMTITKVGQKTKDVPGMASWLERTFLMEKNELSG